MLQQTTVKTVAPYYARFLARWPTVERAGRAPSSTTCCAPGPGSAITRAPATCMPARKPWSSAMAGFFRDDLAALRALPGIGDYTAAAIAAIAFDRAGGAGRRQCRARGGAAVRGRGRNCRRPSRASSGWRRRCCRRARAGDFAQALMDLGATHLLAEAPGLRALSVERRSASRARAATRRLSRARRPSAKANCVAARPSSRCAPTAACCCASVRKRACSARMTEVPGSDWAHDFD